MVTLKSLSAFAIIPAVDYGQVAPEHRPAVGEAIERVLNSAFRETPTSVVDHCRAALTILLSRWLVQSGHESDAVFGIDLGDLAKKVEKLELYCVAKSAQIVALLHSRGKPNVQHAKGARPPENGDDELALQAIGLVLREFGWAA